MSYYDCNHDCDALYEAYDKGYKDGKLDAYAKSIKVIQVWEPIHGVFTPGGDPAYICPVCHDRESEHINGVESRKNWHYCPCCGTELKYNYKEKRKKSENAD